MREPGSAGEHQAQAMFGAGRRALAFYNKQMLDYLNGPMRDLIAVRQARQHVRNRGSAYHWLRHAPHQPLRSRIGASTSNWRQYPASVSGGRALRCAACQAGRHRAVGRCQPHRYGVRDRSPAEGRVPARSASNRHSRRLRLDMIAWRADAARSVSLMALGRHGFCRRVATCGSF
jgi:hypothetical protein